MTYEYHIDAFQRGMTRGKITLEMTDAEGSSVTYESGEFAIGREGEVMITLVGRPHRETIDERDDEVSIRVTESPLILSVNLGAVRLTGYDFHNPEQKMLGVTRTVNQAREE